MFPPGSQDIVTQGSLKKRERDDRGSLTGRAGRIWYKMHNKMQTMRDVLRVYQHMRLAKLGGIRGLLLPS